MTNVQGTSHTTKHSRFVMSQSNQKTVLLQRIISKLARNVSYVILPKQVATSKILRHARYVLKIKSTILHHSNVMSQSSRKTVFLRNTISKQVKFVRLA